MSLLLLSIYKSSKKDEMYLYVPKTDGLKNIPEALLSGIWYAGACDGHAA
jgi:uncharacterized protein YcgL (UPF0745 family)